MRHDTTLSVVIPTLDEAERLPALLSDLRPLGAEILVVDGGSVDATRQLGRDLGARVVEAPAGRGLQLRAGADLAAGDWLFFVHADSRLDTHAVTALRSFLDGAEPTDFAHFRFELERDRAIHRFIEFGQHLRERWLGLVYG
ncbi:MAG: glycosyltransferase, partial [Gemmatimonadota bacterium]|nr:glycosyltransferase [Gemmatimonadota bacterium]